jgi:hypothetical protein
MSKRLISCIAASLICLPLYGQIKQIDLKSGLTKLRIVKDETPPVLTITPGRMVENGFRYVERDSDITVSGVVTDAVGLGYLQVNGVKVQVSPGGRFAATVHLSFGGNLIRLRAVDKRGNPLDTSLVVYHDPSADIKAPVIEIIQPALSRGVRVVPRTPTLTVSGTVADDSPMSRVYVNGVAIDSVVGGRFRCELPTDSLRNILVKAVDSCGNVSFDSLRLPAHYFSGEAENLELPVEGKYYALIIGVEKYKYMDNLKSPYRDATKLSSILTSRYTFEPSNVVVLRDPTRTRILDEFEKMKKRVGESDNLLVFYAGHGTYDEESEQGYWWPSDAGNDNHSNWISNSDIRDNLKRIKSRHTLLIADACFSGRVFQRTRGALDEAPLPIIQAYQKKSRKALTSGEDAVSDNSVFTRALFGTLEGYESRYLTSVLLASLITTEVVTNTGEIPQEPHYGHILDADDRGGDFVFIKRVRK